MIRKCVKVNVGEIFLRKDLVEAIESHMTDVLYICSESAVSDILDDCPFGVFVADYLNKNADKLLKKE